MYTTKLFTCCRQNFGKIEHENPNPNVFLSSHNKYILCGVKATVNECKIYTNHNCGGDKLCFYA